MTPAATDRPADPGSGPSSPPPPDSAYRSELSRSFDEGDDARRAATERDERAERDEGAERDESDEAGEDTDEPKGHWWTRTPLRVKLVAAVLSLMTIALLLVGAASVVALQGYLVDRVDGQLDAFEASLPDDAPCPRAVRCRATSRSACSATPGR